MNQAGPIRALPEIYGHRVYKAGIVCGHVPCYTERPCYSKSEANMQRETNSDERRLDGWMGGVEFPVLAPKAVVH